MFDDTARIKDNMFEKGYYDIDSIPDSDALNFIEKNEYIQRYHTGETFEMEDHVSFDNFTKTGIVNGMSTGILEIQGNDGLQYKIQKDTVFLKSDVTQYGHWNTMSTLAKKLILKQAGITVDFSESLWKDINKEVQELILKVASPAGYSGNADDSYGTTKPGTYNPVSENKTLADRLKEEIDQNEEKD